MKLPFLQVLCSAALLCAWAVGLADQGKDESGKGREAESYSSDKNWKDKDTRKEEERRRDHGGSSYFHEHGYTRLNIPRGHYPPPGECRIWYPDRPAGQQAPPGRCSPVPPGAWVIRHPRDLQGNVHVVVYEPDRPNVVRVVGQFEIASGVFVRVVMQR